MDRQVGRLASYGQTGGEVSKLWTDRWGGLQAMDRQVGRFASYGQTGGAVCKLLMDRRGGG